MTFKMPVHRFRAISCTQPWCGLMAAGEKPIENREKPIIAPRDFGTYLGLHATRTIDAAVYPRIREIAPELDEGLVYDEAAMQMVPTTPWGKLARITSAVIAVGVIDRVIKALGRDQISGRYIYDPEDLQGLGEQKRWLFGRYGYVFASAPVILPTPVPCRGWQGFWSVDAHTDREIRDQLGGLTVSEVA